MAIHFTAYGNVQPAHRPRASVVNGHVHQRNDPRHTNWMRVIQMQAMSHRPETLLDGPLSLRVEFYLLQPKSVRRQYPAVKPDLSNLLKAVEDALNGLLWTDDSRIVELVVHKHYGNPSRVEVAVQEIGEHVREGLGV